MDRTIGSSKNLKVIQFRASIKNVRRVYQSNNFRYNEP